MFDDKSTSVVVRSKEQVLKVNISCESRFKAVLGEHGSLVVKWISLNRMKLIRSTSDKRKWDSVIGNRDW